MESIDVTKACYDKLKTRQREERHTYGEYLTVRVHRALSWLNKANECEDDSDSQVIFLWIAFNAAYANEISDQHRPASQKMFNDFLNRLSEMDGDNRLSSLVWSEFPNSIRVLLDNKYVFQPFWDHVNGKISEEDWTNHFLKAKSSASKALSNEDTSRVLAIVLSRIYTLRNQLIHGGATWNSHVNRDQIRDCSKILERLVPVVIEIMMDNPHELWGQPCYPVIPF
jgi:hypothetical protein